jgi:tRNA(adenine34) deaminase
VGFLVVRVILLSTTDAERWMEEAIALAREAASIGEVPIGCVIVHEPTGQIVGRGCNRREIDRDPTAHAEMIALREAGRALDHWRLLDCALVVTLEPCPMCAGGMVNARVPKLIYGCDDPKAGAVRTLYRLCEDGRLNHRLEIVAGIRAEACAQLLKDFFKAQRALGKK